MSDTADIILARLTADDSPHRAALAALAVDHTLDLPVRALVDPEEVLDLLVGGLTQENLDRVFTRHLRPAKSRREARWRETGERAGELVSDEIAARIETLLSRPDGPNAAWAKDAIDPADVRALLAPALREVLLSFVEKIAALTPKVPKAPEPRAPSRFGFRDRIKKNLKERSEQIVGAAGSVLDGLGLDFRERLEETANEFGESASGVLRKGVEKRLESDEGKEILARMRVQLFRRLLDTPLAELAGDASRVDESDAGAVLGSILAYNATRAEVRQALSNEAASVLSIEGDRSLRELFAEAGVLDQVRAPTVQRAATLSQDLFASEPFAAWLKALVAP